MEVQTFLLALMLFIITVAHLNWFRGPNRKIIKFLIIMSFALFVVIFAEHYMYTQRRKKAICNELTFEELARLKSDKLWNADNMAVRLVEKLSTHPIFQCI